MDQRNSVKEVVACYVNNLERINNGITRSPYESGLMASRIAFIEMFTSMFRDPTCRVDLHKVLLDLPLQMAGRVEGVSSRAFEMGFVNALAFLLQYDKVYALKRRIGHLAGNIQLLEDLQSICNGVSGGHVMHYSDFSCNHTSPTCVDTLIGSHLVYKQETKDGTVLTATSDAHVFLSACKNGQIQA